MATKTAEVSFDGMSVDEILALAEKAKTKAMSLIQENKEEGINKIRDIINDYHLNAKDLSDVFSTAGAEESAVYCIDGKYWAAGQGKTPDYVIQFLRKGNSLRDVVYKNRVTEKEANEKESKIKSTDTYKSA